MASLYAIASDLSYEVLQRRRGEGELAAPELDPRYRELQPSMPVRVVRRLRELDEAEFESDWFIGLKRRHGSK